MKAQMTHRQAMTLMDRIEKHRETLGLQVIGLIPQWGQDKKGRPTYGAWYSVSVVDLRTGEDIVLPAAVTTYAALLAWRGVPEQVATTRDLDLRLRVNDTEKDRVVALASEAGQSVSDFIRSRIGL